MADNIISKNGCIIFCLILLPACGSDDAPNLGGLYSDLAKADNPDRNPIIVIPGVLGSKLVDTESGTVAWGEIGRGLENPKKDVEIRRIALPMHEGKTLQELRDSVITESVLESIKITIYGVTVEKNAYGNILASLGVGGFINENYGETKTIDYGDRHYTSFQFAYDWRRDLVEAAKQLHEYILEKRTYVQNEIAKRHGIENKDVKFNIVAHSMGGLVARYYLRYGVADLPDDGSLPPLTWAGSRFVEQVVLIGTPNAGSIDTFRLLIEGSHLAPGLPSFDAAILGTMPALYQLLPRARHGHVVSGIETKQEFMDPYDPVLWEQMGWGLANHELDSTLQVLLPEVKDKETRIKIALNHQRKSLMRAKAFAQALDIPAVTPPGLSINLIAGDAVDTADVIKVNTETGEVENYKTGAGDGKVLRSSALMDERVGSNNKGRLKTPIQWANVLFLFSDHLGLTTDPVFTDNILYMLLEQPLNTQE
jgi:pimeloyl-ACP methyl ester carboxylesterase